MVEYDGKLRFRLVASGVAIFSVIELNENGGWTVFFSIAVVFSLGC